MAQSKRRKSREKKEELTLQEKRNILISKIA